MRRLGFIGTGALAEAFITGFNRQGTERHAIAVSARSEGISRSLADRYRNVRRMPSNAAVIGDSDLVFIAVRPRQFEEAMAGLAFRPEQQVVSLMAGVPLDAVRAMVAPAAEVYRLMAIPTVGLGKGPLLIFPDGGCLREILDGLGEIIAAESEDALISISNASALMSSYFAFQNTVADWIRGREVPPDVAEHYARAMFEGLAAVGLELWRSGQALHPEHYETKDGLNAFCRACLHSHGWYDLIARALDGVEARQSSIRAAPE